MALNDAQKKVTEFLTISDDNVLDHMHMDISVIPPVLVYKDGEKFVALDPAGGQFFIDPNYIVSEKFNFYALPEIQSKVDKWGKSLMDKAKAEYISTWLQNMTF